MARTATQLACAGLAAIAAIAGAGEARADPKAVAALGEALRAYDAGDLATARRHLRAIPAAAELSLVSRDYVLWLRGMIALRGGDPAAARGAFTQLGKIAGSRFSPEVLWRLADAAWEAGDRREAAQRYRKLVAAPSSAAAGDVGTARFRIAEASAPAVAVAAYRQFLLAHPAHPLADRAARRLAQLGAPPWTPADRIARAQQLTAARAWDAAVTELGMLGDDLPPALAGQRDFWLGTALFRMRRRYGEAGELLLGVYRGLGAEAPSAMFHGARALSRADRDDEAIEWYGKVVEAYPRSPYAEEAQYLRGWLQFNRGRYRDAIAPLAEVLRRYPRSKWVDDALWFLAMSHYLLGEWEPARTRLRVLARGTSALEAGKAMYWLARIDDQLSSRAAAAAGYTATVARYPFSWYALLARSRLTALGGAAASIGPFGPTTPPPRGPPLAARSGAGLSASAADPLLARADELLAAGLLTDASEELARGERGLLQRLGRDTALPLLLDRYRRAENYHRPWMIAAVYAAEALRGPPEGDARLWWEHAYPRAYRSLVEKHQALGKNPEGYLYSVMRQESGFGPHVVSYADAQGLLQMIPPTAQRVARELGIRYEPGRLFEPDYNIQTASWYIGRMLVKFKGQIPLGAGSYNSGPRPMMRWLDRHGDREIDEVVELVPFTQTRDYMKKVTENFARYRYLYGGEVYVQPLDVDRSYVRDQLTY